MKHTLTYGLLIGASLLSSNAFAGIYGGVHGGYISSPTKVSSDYKNAINATRNGTSKDSLHGKGAMGGVHLGCQGLFNNWLLGLETSVDLSRNKGNQKITLGSGVNTWQNLISFKSTYAQDLSVKLGYRIQNYTPYIKVGGAWSKYHAKIQSNDHANLLDGKKSKVRAGVKLAAGIELPLLEHVTWGLEYAHTLFQSIKVKQPIPLTSNVVDHRFKTRAQTVTLRLSYHF